MKPTVQAFLTEPRIATLTTLRPDGTPHVAPVRFTWDDMARTARVLTVATSRKARNVATGGRVALCQPDGFRWVTLEGAATLSADPDRVATAARWYHRRYRCAPPAPSGRVVIEIAVDCILTLNL
ncbi:TIGR03618 family F420-dependent PPOX class oxidoreductase [Nocardia sp. NPDC005366]|uniref:pyridoxamine 5'-phosphate oxidase family protein n=1 Tax=Nocardia sp. NPDC005366 TaxID=3156878 RepID=UPI0033B430B5